MKKNTLLGGLFFSGLVLGCVVWLSGCSTLTPQQQAIQNEVAAVTPVAEAVTDAVLMATGNAAVVPLNNLAVGAIEVGQKAEAAGAIAAATATATQAQVAATAPVASGASVTAVASSPAASVAGCH